MTDCIKKGEEQTDPQKGPPPFHQCTSLEVQSTIIILNPATRFALSLSPILSAFFESLPPPKKRTAPLCLPNYPQCSAQIRSQPPPKRGFCRHLKLGGTQSRTEDRGFAGPCLNHLAMPPHTLHGVDPNMN